MFLLEVPKYHDSEVVSQDSVCIWCGYGCVGCDGCGGCQGSSSK
jgi:hypothetical protein